MTLRVRWGGILGSIVIAKTEIVEVHAGKMGEDLVLANSLRLRQEAEDAVREPKRSAELWLRLAEYFQRHPGYYAQAREALERALVFDPDHPVARAKLGYVMTEKGWAEIEKPKPKGEPPAPPVAQQPPAGGQQGP